MPIRGEDEVDAYEEWLDALERGQGLDPAQALRIAEAILPQTDAPAALVSRAADVFTSRGALESAVREFAETLRQRLKPKAERVELHLIVPRLVYWDLAIDLGHKRAHVGAGELPETAHFGGEPAPFTVVIGTSSVTIACDELPGPTPGHALHVSALNVGGGRSGNWIANAIPHGTELRNSKNLHAGVDLSSALASLFRVLAGRLLQR